MNVNFSIKFYTRVNSSRIIGIKEHHKTLGSLPQILYLVLCHSVAVFLATHCKQIEFICLYSYVNVERCVCACVF